MDDDTAANPSAEPATPFSPEDVAYQVIVNEYLGLRRAGANPVDAALITAAHLMVMGLANTRQQGAGGV